MDSLTHFHSRNVYLFIHLSNSLKVTALDMFQIILGLHPLITIEKLRQIRIPRTVRVGYAYAQASF